MSEDRPPPRPETGGGGPPPPPGGGGADPAPPSGPPSPPPPTGPARPFEPPPGRSADPIALRPRNVGAILDAAVRLYRGHWTTLMAIVAVLLVPSTFLLTAISVSGSFAATIIASVLQYVIVTPLLSAAVVKASADVYLEEPLTVGGTYRFVWGKIGRLVGLVVLVVVVVAVPAVVLVMVLSAVPPVLAVVMGLACLGVLVFLAVRFYFAATTIVLEDLGTIAALARSWRLTGGHFWKMAGTLLLALILAVIVSTIIATPFSIPFLLASLSGEGGNGGILALFVQTFGNTIAAIITEPFTSLVGVLLYFDLRIRDEGFDLEVLARELRRS